MIKTSSSATVLALFFLVWSCAESGESKHANELTTTHEETVTTYSGLSVPLEQFVLDVKQMSPAAFSLKYGDEAADNRMFDYGPGADPIRDLMAGNQELSRQQKLDLAHRILGAGE